MIFFLVKVSEEENQKMASQLKLNMADYKSQLELAMAPSTNHYQWCLTDSTLVIKKLTSKDLSFRIAVVLLQEVELLSSLPEFMAVIVKSINQMTDDIAAKNGLIESLSKGTFYLHFRVKIMHHHSNNLFLIFKEKIMFEERCTKYAEINEDQPKNLYTNFCRAFNHLKERTGDAGIF